MCLYGGPGDEDDCDDNYEGLTEDEAATLGANKDFYERLREDLRP